MGKKKWLKLTIIFTLIFQLFAVPFGNVGVMSETTNLLLKTPVVEDDKLKIEWITTEYFELDQVDLIRNDRELSYHNHVEVTKVNENEYSYVYYDKNVNLEEEYTYSVVIGNYNETYKSSAFYKPLSNLDEHSVNKEENAVANDELELIDEDDFIEEEDFIDEEDLQDEDRSTREDEFLDDDLLNNEDTTSNEEEDFEEDFYDEEHDRYQRNYHLYDEEQDINIYNLKITDESIAFKLTSYYYDVDYYSIYVDGELTELTNFYVIPNLEPNTEYTVKIEGIDYDETVVSEREYKLTTAETVESEEVHIPDEVLEREIREQVGIFKRPLTKNDLEKLEELYFWYGDVEDLTGIEYATNLRGLTLTYSNISNLEPLANLTNLSWLYLDHNQIDDLTALSKLENLGLLSVKGNQISNIDLLLDLPNLYHVGLTDNLLDLDTSSSTYQVIEALLNNDVHIEYEWTEHFSLDIYATENSIEIEWDLWFDDSHISSYVILLNDEYVGEVDRQTKYFEITELAPQTYYDVRVVAIDHDGLPRNHSWTYEAHTKAEPQGDVVTFEDETLEQFVRNELRIFSRSLRESDLEQLTQLSIYDDPISSLSGLEFATELRYLYISDSQLEDFTAIHNLTNLRTLELYNVGITDISVLEGLNELRYLYLGYNNIIDINVLLKLPKLSYVTLWGNPIDLSMNSNNMEVITQLEDRGIDVNYPRPQLHTGYVSEATAQLYWYFDEYGVDINSYEIVVNGETVNHTNIKEDYFYNFVLTDLVPNTEYEIYVVGHADGTPIAKTATISFTTKSIPNGDDVIFADKLLEEQIRTHFGVEHRNIKTDDMEELYYFYFYGINDHTLNLSGLETAINLMGLSLENVSVDNFDIIIQLTSLIDLNLFNVNLGDLSPLNNLINLEYLYLVHAGIEDLSFLENMSGLRHLNLSNNEIKSINVLSSLSNVRSVHLYNNEIEDISPLLQMKNLEYVTLWGNLLDLSENSTTFNMIKKLEERDVYVQYEEPHYSDLVISEITDTTITIDLAATARGSEYDYFQLFIDGEFYIDIDGSASFYEIDGLNPYTTYEIGLVLVADGWDDYVEAFVTTLSTTPDYEEPIEPKPEQPVTYSLELTDISSTTFTVSWADSLERFEATESIVYVNNKKVEEFDSSLSTFTAENLNPNSWNTVRVVMLKENREVEMNRTVRTRQVERVSTSFQAVNKDGEAVDRRLEFYLEGVGPHNKNQQLYGYTDKGFLRLWHQSSTSLSIPVGTYNLYIFGNGKYVDTLFEGIEITSGEDYVNEPMFIEVNEIDLSLGNMDIVINNEEGSPINKVDYVSIYSPSVTSAANNYDFGYRYAWDTETTNGIFSFKDLAYAQDYQISIGSEGYRTYNGTFKFTEENSSLEITLEKGAKVTGSVITENGNQVIGANIYAYNNNVWEYATTKTNGEFIVYGLDGNDITIDVSMTGFETQRFTVSKSDFVNNSFDLGQVQLSPERYVEGILKDKNGNPARNVSVMLFEEGANWSSYWTRTDSNGYFKFRNVTNQTYTLKTESFNYPNVEVGEITPKNEPYHIMLTEKGTGNFTGDGNRFSSSVATVVPGKTMRYRLDYKNNGTDAAENVILDLNLSDKVTLIEETVLLNGQEIILENGKAVISRVEAGEAGTFRFQVKVNEDVSQQIVSTAKIQYGENEVNLSATTNVLFVDMQVPEVTATPKVKVYGTAKVGSTVEVFDGQRLLGTTEVTSRWWYMDVNLPVREGTESTHNLVAKVTEGSEVFLSEPKQISYKPEVASIEEVTIHAGWNSGVTLNPNTGVATFAIVEFTPIDVEVSFDKLVDEVYIHFIGETYQLNYNAQKEKYVGQFPPGWSSYGEQMFEISFKQGDTTTRLPLMEVIVLIDPSGYVFEGSMDNRLPGATAIVEEFKNNRWVMWNAEFFGQINPQITDEDGRYGWDVYQGDWRVIFSKEGFETYISRIVTVPPEETELNVPLVRISNPEVIGTLYNQGTLTISFDRLMDQANVDDHIRVYDHEGQLVEGSFDLEDYFGYREVEPGSGYYEPNEDQLLSQTFVWSPAEPLAPNATYDVVISSGIKDYDNKPLEADYQSSFTTPEAVNDDESSEPQPGQDPVDNEQPSPTQPGQDPVDNEQPSPTQPGQDPADTEQPSPTQPEKDQAGNKQPVIEKPKQDQKNDAVQKPGYPEPKDSKSEKGQDQLKDVVTKPKVQQNKATVDMNVINQVQQNGQLQIDLSKYKNKTEVSLALTKEQVELLKQKNAKILLDKGDVTLNIPVSNLKNEQVEISVKKLADIEKALSSIYDFTILQGNSIISTFSEKVVLTFHIDKSKVKHPEQVQLFYWNEQKSEWELIGGTYNASEGTLQAATSHFSTYAVFDLTEAELNDMTDQVTPKEQDGSLLPKTATHMFSYMVLGMLLLLAGLFIARRRKLA
ncbi:leucine-rich repeat domain-containing protein [Alkalihalobacterium sp. APHAB7]|uniref:leucine-rich repeat domain-containing protein n=1 Tax=Alkalihalobacterium sp. APHAB7 TaxID=3402081 RepID=UPI003AAF819D